MKTAKIKNKKRLEEKLWAIVANYIKDRDSFRYDSYIGKCVSCGEIVSGANCQAGHYMPNFASSILRYHPHNIHIQCRGCNIAITKQQAERVKVKYAQFMYLKYGQEYVNKLLELQKVHFDEQNLQDLMELYLKENESNIIKYLEVLTKKSE